MATATVYHLILDDSTVSGSSSAEEQAPISTGKHSESFTNEKGGIPFAVCFAKDLVLL